MGFKKNIVKILIFVICSIVMLNTTQYHPWNLFVIFFIGGCIAFLIDLRGENSKSSREAKRKA